MATVVIRIVQKGARRTQAAIQGVADELDKAVTKNDRRVIQLGRNISDVGRTLTFGLTLPIAALGFASVKAATRLDSLTRGLVTVTGSAAEAAIQMKELEALARLPGLGFTQVLRGAAQLQASGIGRQLSVDALREFGNALAAVGRGKADLDGVIRALGQISAKGRVLGQEINQLAERVPQIRVVMKDAFGTASSEEIQEMGIKADEFIRRVVASMATLERATSGAQNTFENLGDAAIKAGNSLGTVMLPVLLPTVRGFTSLLEVIAKLPAPIRVVIVVSGLLLAALGPVLLIVGKLITAVGLLSIALKTALGAAVLGKLALLAPLLLPGSIIIAGLGVLAAGFLSARSAAASLADTVARLNANLSLDQLKQQRAGAADRLKRFSALADPNTNLGQNFQRQAERAHRDFVRIDGRIQNIERALRRMQDVPLTRVIALGPATENLAAFATELARVEAQMSQLQLAAALPGAVQDELLTEFKALEAQLEALTVLRDESLVLATAEAALVNSQIEPWKTLVLMAGDYATALAQAEIIGRTLNDNILTRIASSREEREEQERINAVLKRFSPVAARLQEFQKAGLSPAQAASQTFVGAGGGLGLALEDFARLQTLQKEWTLVLQGDTTALMQLVTAGHLTEQQARDLADALGDVETKASMAGQQMLIGFGGAIEAMISGTDRLAETMIRTATRMLQLSIEAQRAAGAQISPFAGILVGVFGGIAAALAGRRDKPQRVSIDNYSGKALGQLARSRRTDPQLITQQFIGGSGRFTEEDRVQLLRLEDRDAVPRVRPTTNPQRLGQ